MKSNFCLPKNCWDVNFKTLKCNNCLHNYTVNADGLCEVSNCEPPSLTCTTCATGYYLSNGICLQIPSNCDIPSYNATDKCTQCTSVFYSLKNGKCLPAECDIPNGETQCAKCKNGFELNEN